MRPLGRWSGTLLACLLIFGSRQIISQAADPAAQPLSRPDLADYSFTPGSARALTEDGAWLRDAQGRYVLLRGMNIGSRSKLSPYIPVMPLAITTLDDQQFEAEMQAVQPQLDQLRSLGMNVVRLPVMWQALEPTPNPNLDELLPAAVSYLQHVQKIIDAFYANGMFVIVDFHQDIASEEFGGDGFPSWALAFAPEARRHPRRRIDTNWVTNYYAPPWWARWICQCSKRRNGVMKTLQLFWQDGNPGLSQAEGNSAPSTEPGVQTHFIRTVGLVARFFAVSNSGAGNPAILGYEPFNEPQQAGLDKKRFEPKILPAFYHRVETEIGKYDPKALIFIEPRSDWTTYSATGPDYQGLHFTLDPISYLPAPYRSASTNPAIFSFHYYDPWMMVQMPFSGNMERKAEQWPKVFQSLRATADATGLVPFLTEFGCSQDWKGSTDLRPEIYHHRVIRACMDLQYTQVEAQLLNSAYWNYDLYNSKKFKDNWNGQNFSLLGPSRAPRNLDIVARPYPMRSSARPVRVFFDLETKNAAFILEGTVSDAPTVIFVPALNYLGHQFEVRTTTPTSTVFWDKASQLLYWYPDPALARNQLILSLPGGFRPQVLPAESQALLPQTRFVTAVNPASPAPGLGAQ